MNKIFLFALAAIMAFCFISCGSANDAALTAAPAPAAEQPAAEAPEAAETPAPAEAEPEAEPEPESAPAADASLKANGGGYEVEVLSVKGYVDELNQSILMVDCLFTNNNSAPECFGDSVSVTVTQNGVSLSYEDVILDYSVLESTRIDASNGQKLKVSNGFTCTDFSTPVEITVTIRDFGSKTTLASESAVFSIEH